ncbi:MAG: FAD-dependent oxidoreductase [Nitrospiraceae bacterium]|nr:FAD-dependent oxidoreductase [Nitrospiraceae bacterium]
MGAAVAQTCLYQGSAHAAQSAPKHYDLVVVGIGSGGFGAALAGARQGLSVLCLEKAGAIGGNAVRSGVTMWEPGVGGTGFPFQIYKRLKATENAVAVYSFGRHVWWVGWEGFPGGEHVVDPVRRYVDTLRRHRSRDTKVNHAFRKEHWHGVVFEPDCYERVLRAMLAEIGRVTLVTDATFDVVEAGDGRIAGLQLTNGERITAGAYVDGTGGGALCKACGCEMMYGQEARDVFDEPSAPAESNDRINGVTLIFRITPTEEARVEPLPEGVPETCWWGRFPAMSAVQYPNGDYNCNMLPTMTGEDFARMGYPAAYAECERRVRAFWRHVQTGWPEFQRCRIAWIAPALGVRETTRVRGEYVLTEHDLGAGLSGQQHPDVITIADHAVDRHGAGGGGGEMGEPYGVPYRCLIPKDFRNLLIACRGASFSSLAASSCRLSRTMMQLGQAAGTAAALARGASVDLPQVPADRLRAVLREQRVELDWPRSAALDAYLRRE